MGILGQLVIVFLILLLLDPVPFLPGSRFIGVLPGGDSISSRIILRLFPVGGFGFRHFLLIELHQPDAGGAGCLAVLVDVGEGLGEKLGSEELMILSLILILSAAGGDGCDSPGEVILLLALLLTAAS